MLLLVSHVSMKKFSVHCTAVVIRRRVGTNMQVTRSELLITSYIISLTSSRQIEDLHVYAVMEEMRTASTY